MMNTCRCARPSEPGGSNARAMQAAPASHLRARAAAAAGAAGAASAARAAVARLALPVPARSRRWQLSAGIDVCTLWQLAWQPTGPPGSVRPHIGLLPRAAGNLATAKNPHHGLSFLQTAPEGQQRPGSAASAFAPDLMPPQSLCIATWAGIWRAVVGMLVWWCGPQPVQWAAACPRPAHPDRPREPAPPACTPPACSCCRCQSRWSRCQSRWSRRWACRPCNANTTRLHRSRWSPAGGGRGRSAAAPAAGSSCWPGCTPRSNRASRQAPHPPPGSTAPGRGRSCRSRCSCHRTAPTGRPAVWRPGQ